MKYFSMLESLSPTVGLLQINLRQQHNKYVHWKKIRQSLLILYAHCACDQYYERALI